MFLFSQMCICSMKRIPTNATQTDRVNYLPCTRFDHFSNRMWTIDVCVCVSARAREYRLWPLGVRCEWLCGLFFLSLSIKPFFIVLSCDVCMGCMLAHVRFGGHTEGNRKIEITECNCVRLCECVCIKEPQEHSINVHWKEHRKCERERERKTATTANRKREDWEREENEAKKERCAFSVLTLN